MVVFTMCRNLYWGRRFYTKTFYSLSEAAQFYAINFERVANVKCTHKQRKIFRNKIQSLMNKRKHFLNEHLAQGESADRNSATRLTVG